MSLLGLHCIQVVTESKAACCRRLTSCMDSTAYLDIPLALLFDLMVMMMTMVMKIILMMMLGIRIAPRLKVPASSSSHQDGKPTINRRSFVLMKCRAFQRGSQLGGVFIILDPNQRGFRSAKIRTPQSIAPSERSVIISELSQREGFTSSGIMPPSGIT